MLLYRMYLLFMLLEHIIVVSRKLTHLTFIFIENLFMKSFFVGNTGIARVKRIWTI